MDQLAVLRCITFDANYLMRNHFTNLKRNHSIKFQKKNYIDRRRIIYTVHDRKTNKPWVH